MYFYLYLTISNRNLYIWNSQGCGVHCYYDFVKLSLSTILDPCTMTTKIAILGIKLSEEDKAVIRKIASENRLTMSVIVRLLIADGLAHIGERNILRRSEVEA
jgi:hypothetical protein